MPADAYASYAASISRSSAPLSQCSPNFVQPMPMMATRSLMPLLAMFVLLVSSAPRARLPEVVHDAVRREHAAKRHLDLVADRDLLGLAVRHLAEEAAAAVEVEHDADRRRVHREREAVEREGRDARAAVGERVGLHLVLRAAADAHALGRELR